MSQEAIPSTRASAIPVPSLRPFTEVILKVASRCNIKCSYCYMFELADRGSWRQQPHVMTLDVAQAVAGAAALHAASHGLPSLDVIFHGGEPLLAGPRRLAAYTTAFRDALSAAGVKASFKMQANATLLTREVLAVLSAAGISVGVSFDGDDDGITRRRLASGAPARASVTAGIGLLRRPEWRHLYGGLLAVINLAADPVEVYEALCAQEPPAMDFLLPLAHWDARPQPGTGQWLSAVFDRWYQDPGAPRIRMFTILVSRLIGRDVRSGFLGAPPDTSSLVVQPDGSAELLDALRSISGTAVSTGLSVLTSSLDDIARHPGYIPPPPARACRACRWFVPCGGGYYPHRFSQSGGYDNPSAYCDDLTFLIAHIRGRLAELGHEDRLVA